MPVTKFEQLPNELLVRIASFAKPSAVLHLSKTSRAIRAACWDFQVFREWLLAAQSQFWAQDSLDLDAFASRANTDVTIWAQYAIADERMRTLHNNLPLDPSWHVADDEHPLKRPKKYMNYLPELFVVKHPFMSDRGWESGAHAMPDANPSQIFCVIMTVLATNSDMLKLSQKLYREDQSWFYRNSDTSAYLWALCTISLWARSKVRQRLAAWPYNDAAIVPFISIPSAAQIPLRPLNDKYDVPAPFSRRPSELLSSEKFSFSAWDSWYRLHNQAAFESATFFTDSTWCGYFIRFGSWQAGYLGIDAPMVDIKFEIGDQSHHATDGSDAPRKLILHANECRDGSGVFSLQASATSMNDGIKMNLAKIYQNGDIGLDWDCRLTPFGIVGFVGLMDRLGDISPHHRSGIVWLWKSSWTDSSME